jgi:hypothetical protein
MSVPDVHDKPTEINRLPVQQLLFKHLRLCQAFHVSLQNLPYRGAVALGKGIVQTHCSAKPVELQWLQATLLHNTP